SATTQRTWFERPTTVGIGCCTCSGHTSAFALRGSEHVGKLRMTGRAGRLLGCACADGNCVGFRTPKYRPIRARKRQASVAAMLGAHQPLSVPIIVDRSRIAPRDNG